MACTVTQQSLCLLTVRYAERWAADRVHLLERSKVTRPGFARIAALVVAVVILLALPTSAGAQSPLNPCIGGCDMEYPVTYDVREMWNTYGYPEFILYSYGPPRPEGCYWYDGTEIDGLWW